MYSRRSHQRRISIVALLAMVASLVAAPFAQAHAMRLAAVGQDLCVAAPDASASPAAPAHHGQATHAAQCECCTGSGSGFAPSRVMAALLSLDTPAVTTFAPRRVVVADAHPARGGQPRAPPILA